MRMMGVDGERWDDDSDRHSVGNMAMVHGFSVVRVSLREV